MAADNPIDFNKYIGGEEALKSAARSVRSLKTDVTALSKSVDDDAERIKAGFGKIAAALKELQGNGGKLQLTSDADRQLLQDYIKQVGDLKKAKQELQQTEQAQAALQKGLSDAAKEYTSELAKQKDALRAAAAARDEAGQKAAAAAIRQITTETAQLSKALRGANSEFTAAKGSYDALVIENNKLLASLHALEGGMNSGSQEALKLKKQIFDNTETLKNFDTETNRSFRNVGNYAQSFSGLIAELAKARAAQAGLSEGTADYSRNQLRISGFQTAAQKSAANMGLSYEQAEAKINGATAAIAPLVNNLVRLEKEQEAVAVSAGKDSEAYQRIGFAIQSANKKIAETAESTDKAGTGFADLRQQLGFDKQGLVGAVTQLGVGFIGVQAIVGSVTAAFSTNSEFQSALSSLSALTGATGEDLQFMSDKAQELGPSVGKSATEVLKAFELIGSAQPELLKNKEALTDVTAEALKLAAASGDDLPAAAAALTGVMNQFQAPAKEAARYVNALAAGAKEGAATIPQAAESMKYFGVNAASANVSIEQSVALIQVLAERSIKGEQAGANLRNVFAKLASGAKDTNPEIVGLEKALDNLGAKNLSTAQYTKMFGLENANAAKILVESRDKVKTLTSAVTGTNVANEQAARQLDNVAQASNRFFSILKNGAINSLGGLVKGFGSLLNTLSDLTLRLTGVTHSFDDEIEISGKSIQANTALAHSSQTLVNRYEELTAKGVTPTAAGKKELARITLQLRDNFGESVTSINKETGALELNLAATKELIKQKLLLSNQEASTLALRAQKLGEDIKQQELLNKSLQLEVDVRRENLAAAGISATEANRLYKIQVDAESRGQVVRGKSVELVDQFIEAQRQLAVGQDHIADADEKRRTILAKLLELGFSLADIEKLFAGNVDAATNALNGQGKAAAALDETLDRAAKARSDRRRGDLQGEEADNQRRIDEMKKYQAEQGKLFEDQQLTPEIFAARVAGSQDAIIALERKGVALRLRVAREETAGKLAEIDNERIKSSAKKGISTAELADIQAAANEKTLAATRELERKVAQIRREGQARLDEEPVEFKVGKLDMTQADKDLQRAIDNSEKQVVAAGQTLQKQLDDEVAAVKEAEERKRDLRQRGIEIGIAAGNAYFDYQAGRLEAQGAAEQASYDQGVKNAGENAKLREALDAEHQRKQAALRRKEAENQRSQALFGIFVNTAMAVGSDLGKYGLPLALPFIAADVVLGGIQAALVASRPIPQFFKGRRGGEAIPFAEVAERGPELIREAKTNTYKYVAARSIIPLGQGDDVYTADETRRVLAGASADAAALRHPLQLGSTLSAATHAIQAGRVEIVNAGRPGDLQEIRDAMRAQTAVLGRLKQVTVNVHGEGATAETRQGSSLVRALNQRLQNYGD